MQLTAFLLASFSLLTSGTVPVTEQQVHTYEDHIRQVYESGNLAAYDLDFDVFERAYIGYTNLKATGRVDKQVLSIADFNKSSNEKRLWVIDLKHNTVLTHSLVAHGRNTGNEFARHFSNEPGSYKSSLGFYVTGDTYYGKHGLSLRLHGQEHSINDKAYERAIVMHGADYVSKTFTRQYGRIGRSLGCPAVPADESDTIIGQVKGGTVLYLHHDTPSYVQASNFQDKKAAAAHYFEA